MSTSPECPTFPDETTQEPKDTEIVKWGNKKNNPGENE